MLTAKARQLRVCRSRLNTLAIRLSLSTCDRSKRWERSTRRASLFSIKKDRIEMRGCRAWNIKMSMVQLISSGKRSRNNKVFKTCMMSILKQTNRIDKISKMRANRNRKNRRNQRRSLTLMQNKLNSFSHNCCHLIRLSTNT